MSSSHATPRIENSNRASTESLILADAFAEFISASSRLEMFYGDLQKEVSQLGQELTERNAALHASLQQNEESCRTLRQVLEALPCGVVVMDESGDVSLMNAEARRLVDSEERLPAELMQQVHASATSCQEREFTLQAGGMHRALAVRGRQVGQGAGPMVAVLRDVSRQREMNHDWWQQYKTVALAEARAALAEEMRSPLASIELFTNLIANEKGDASRWIAHLRTSTRALAETLNHAVRPGGN